jgi:arsenate reductase
MFPKITEVISQIDLESITNVRKEILNPIREFIQSKIEKNEAMALNFICTHNSRRSHLSQIWAQVMVHYFDLKHIYCYSGGTEATAMFPKIIETLILQGFEIEKLHDASNSIYAIKYDEKAPAIIGFSKAYPHFYNPKSDFVGMMTCNDADENCPVVFGASSRFALNYEDPKLYDDTPIMNEKYLERSLQIANEMYYLFGK